MLLVALDRPAIFVNGNGERALRELRAGRDGSEREHWLRDQHSEATHAFLETFVDSAVVTVTGLGAVRFCHGSPRSDTSGDPLTKEMIETLRTPPSPSEVIEHAEGLAFRE
jgi:hypothetical protein